MRNKLTISGILFIVTGIIFGAFGAHALKEILDPEKLQSFETGVRYQIYHGLGLLILGLSIDRVPFSLNTFYVLILSGIIFFSGSIYLLAMQEPIGLSFSFLGPVTPIGGLFLITGWVVLLVQTIKRK